MKDLIQIIKRWDGCSIRVNIIQERSEITLSCRENLKGFFTLNESQHIKLNDKVGRWNIYTDSFRYFDDLYTEKQVKMVIRGRIRYHLRIDNYKMEL
jgi:hypothetical protein